MKAKVIETGEIVDVTPYPTWYKENGQGPDRREWYDEELEFIRSEKVEESLEVDLEKEVSDWWNVHYAKISDHYHEFDKYSGHYMLNSTIIDFARYFFELGLKAKGE